MNKFKIKFHVSYLLLMILGFFMIALLGYTQQLESEQDASPYHQQSSLKTELLQKLSDDLGQYDIEHDMDFSQAVLRFTSEELVFPSGKVGLPKKQQMVWQDIAWVLEKNLSCYANGQEAVANLQCQAPPQAKLKSIVIEGHADNVPVSATIYAKDNIELSAKRAKAVYEKIVNKTLLGLQNNASEALFTTAAYGDSQPLNHYSLPTPDAKNRRIDIRFIFL